MSPPAPNRDRGEKDSQDDIVRFLGELNRGLGDLRQKVADLGSAVGGVDGELRPIKEKLADLAEKFELVTKQLARQTTLIFGTDDDPEQGIVMSIRQFRRFMEKLEKEREDREAGERRGTEARETLSKQINAIKEKRWLAIANWAMTFASLIGLLVLIVKTFWGRP